MSATFAPRGGKPKNSSVSHLRLEFTPDKAAQLRDAAEAHGVSLRSFCSQAIDFALENLAKARGDQ